MKHALNLPLIKPCGFLPLGAATAKKAARLDERPGKKSIRTMGQ
jgi:hypothetical protein